VPTAIENVNLRRQRYLARVFACSRKTITKGLRELSGNNYEGDYIRQRIVGGGRKKKKQA
jgi:hypothetical protein